MHDSDETNPLAGQGADEALLLSCVIDGASHGVYAGTQCRFRDDPPIPDCCNQVVLADDSVTIFDQVFEEIEHPRCHGNQLRPATQLAAVGVERKICEAIEQIAVLRPKMPSAGQLSISTVKENEAAVRGN